MMAVPDNSSSNTVNGNDTYNWDIQPRPSSGASNPNGGGYQSTDKSEPLFVGTNTTGNLTLDLNESSTDSQPLVVGTNSNVKITVIGGDNSSSSQTDPVVVGTNNTIIGASNLPNNGQVPLIVATNSTVEFVRGGNTSSSGSTPLVLGTNKTIGSQERTLVSNAPHNDANYQWSLTSGDGVGARTIGTDPLTGQGAATTGDDPLTSGNSVTVGSKADFFRNLFGAGQAPNPDYTYNFDSTNSSGNFGPGGLDFSQFTGGAGTSSAGNPFSAGYSFEDGMTNSNNSGVDLPLVGTNNVIF